MSYPTPAVERAMKVQQVILKAISGNFSGGRPPRFSAFPLARCAAGNNVTSDTVTTGFSTAVVAAPVPGRCRWPRRGRCCGFTASRQYQGFNVAHFTDPLREHYGITLSYQWIKTALQTTGLVDARRYSTC